MLTDPFFYAMAVPAVILMGLAKGGFAGVGAIAMPLLALLTIQSGINQLRYATLKGIMAAKKKEIRKVALPAGLQPSQQIVAIALPVRSKQTQMIAGSPSEAARELVRRLRDEARAL